MKKPLTFALFFTSLLSSDVIYAAGECLAYTGSRVTYLEFESSVCPTVASQTVSGVQCELAPAGDFICIQSGTTSGGGPWIYTGSLYNPPVIDIAPTLPIVDPVPITPPDLTNSTQTANGLIQIQQELVNQRVLSQNLLDNMYKLFNDTGAAYGSMNSNVLQSKFEILRAINDRAAEIRAGVGQVNINQAYYQSDIINRIDAAQLSINGNLQYDTQRILDAISASDNSGDTSSEILDLLNSLKSSAQYSSDMTNQLWNVIGISGSGNCGGFDCPSSPTLAERLANNQQELINAINNTSGGSGDSELIVEKLNYIGSNTYNAERRLRDIDRTFNNVSPQITTMNETLSSISDTLQANHTSLLNALSSGDGSGNGSGQTDDDTETNAKLDGISEQLGTISDSLTGTFPNATDAANSVELPSYSENLDQSFEQINEKINEDSQGMDQITGMKDGLKAYESLPEFFRLAQASCQPIPLGSHSLDLCSYTSSIRFVLTWILYMLTALFMIRSFHASVQNMRF